MEFVSKLERFDSDLWHFHIIVPRDVALHFIDNDRRVVCQINDYPSFQCALMPQKTGDFFININKERRKKMGVVVGEPLTVVLTKDESPYGIPVPEEFEALIEIDELGNKLFHALTPGKQRSLLHLIGKPKKSDTRLRKAIVIIDYLKSTNGKLDFKELNAAFKANRE